jgi:hypothetical protein
MLERRRPKPHLSEKPEENFHRFKKEKAEADGSLPELPASIYRLLLSIQS